VNCKIVFYVLDVFIVVFVDNNADEIFHQRKRRMTTMNWNFCLDENCVKYIRDWWQQRTTRFTWNHYFVNLTVDFEIVIWLDLREWKYRYSRGKLLLMCLMGDDCWIDRWSDICHHNIITKMVCCKGPFIATQLNSTSSVASAKCL